VQSSSQLLLRTTHRVRAPVGFGTVTLKSSGNRVTRACMSLLGWYGVGAMALIVPVFYFVREVRAYLAVSAIIVGAFSVATFSHVRWGQCAEWIVMVVGLLLSVFGLLIVRVMLIRSVSLQLLARIDGGLQESIGEDIGRRLLDMRSFHLICTTPDGKNALTGAGRFVAGSVAILYAIFRVES
jgi:hypothetical protein